MVDHAKPPTAPQDGSWPVHFETVVDREKSSRGANAGWDVGNRDPGWIPTCLEAGLRKGGALCEYASTAAAISHLDGPDDTRTVPRQRAKAVGEVAERYLPSSARVIRRYDDMPSESRHWTCNRPGFLHEEALSERHIANRATIGEGQLTPEYA